MTPLVEVLASLLALRDMSQEAHWTAEGVGFYADHLLYERLYGKLDKPIDKLAEMLVARFGPTPVSTYVRRRSLELLDERVDLTDPKRLLLLESHLLDAIQTALPPFEADPKGLGVADFLVGLAGSREEARYLLGQRTKSLVPERNPRAATPVRASRGSGSRARSPKGHAAVAVSPNPARLAHVPPGLLLRELRRRGHHGEVFGITDVMAGTTPVTACWVEDLRTNQVRRVNATLLTAHDFVELRVGFLQPRSVVKANPRRLL